MSVSLSRNLYCFVKISKDGNAGIQQMPHRTLVCRSDRDSPPFGEGPKRRGLFFEKCDII